MREKHKGNRGRHSPHGEVVVEPHQLHLMAPNCIELWLKENSAASTFDSFTRLILLPKLLMCFMFLQSANSGILEPNPRQYCFQQESFVLTDTEFS